MHREGRRGRLRRVSQTSAGADRLVDGKYRGIGICNMTESTGMGAPAWRSRGLARDVRIDSGLAGGADGRISAHCHAAAQGHMTTFAQIAADYLGADMGDVWYLRGRHRVLALRHQHLASRSAVTGGGAVIRSAAKVAAKIRRIASKILEASLRTSSCATAGAEVTGVPKMNMTFKQIAEVAYSLCDTPLRKTKSTALVRSTTTRRSSPSRMRCTS